MVYLIHFDKKLHHAQHYLGYTKDLPSRIKKHRHNLGARLLQVLNQKNIAWNVVRVWEDGDQNLERHLKNQKKSRKLCPVCRGKE